MDQQKTLIIKIQELTFILEIGILENVDDKCSKKMLKEMQNYSRVLQLFFDLYKDI
jgi:hypothetical protein